jgi:hypothetical protein
MSRIASPSSGTAYGLARVCRVWRTARATVYRHRAPPPADPPARRGPWGPMPDAALVEAIRAVLSGNPFHGEGHRKVWARLRIAGVRTSKRRVLRLMREPVRENLQARLCPDQSDPGCRYRACSRRSLDGGLQHRSPAFPVGLPLTPGVHPVPIRRVSGLIGSTPDGYCSSRQRRKAALRDRRQEIVL